MNTFNNDYDIKFTQNCGIKIENISNYFHFLIKWAIKLDQKIKNIQTWQIFSFFLTIALLSFNFTNVANARVLKKGDQGSDVIALQKALQIQGSFPKTEKLTNYYGETTEKAVKKFQENNGLTVDGIAGDVTQLNLFEKISEDQAEELLNQTENNQTQTQTKSDNNNNNNTSKFTPLKKGSKGQSVIDLQKALKAQGYFPASQNVTNFYGNITEESVKKFQQNQGLKVDGIASAETQQKLFNNPQKQTNNQPEKQSEKQSENHNQTVLKFGQKGAKIKELQQMLQKQGYFPKTTQITNYYGKITEESVKKFQQANNLKVDGIVAQETWQKLVDLNSKSNQISNPENPAKTDQNDNTIDISLKAQANLDLCRRVSIPAGGYLVIRLYPDSNAEEVDVLTNGIKVGIKNQGENGWVPLMEGGFVSSKYLKKC